MTRGAGGGGGGLCVFALFLIDRKSKKKIYFIFDKYKNIFHLVLKISAIPPVLRNREITCIFNTFDDIYLVNILCLFHNLLNLSQAVSQ